MRKKWVLIAAGAGLAAVLILFGIAAFALRGGLLTSRVAATMASALNCDVSMDQLQVQLLPRIRVSGANLSIRLKGRPELPAYISVEHFDVAIGLLSFVRRHIEEVHFDGMHVNVPPPAAQNDIVLPPAMPKNLFRVDRLVTHDAIVIFIARRSGGRPLTFEVHDLELRNAGVDQPMRFVSQLTNPIPEGQVAATGIFGPWNREDPTLTPLEGDYGLKNADLGTINGIGGTLSSTGHFRGTLAEIHADGASSTPDFSLDLGGKPQPLSTVFQVTVDGTDGTTRLDHVEAHLMNTTILVTGAVTNLPGPKNRDVAMNAEVKDGRIEDLLKLAFDSPQPLLTGNVTLTAAVKLPPGPGGAGQRLDASGKLGLAGGRFSDGEMQAKLQELSRRGQGKNADEALARVATDFAGEFSLKQGVVSLSKTEFHVPGAAIQLTGTYTISSQALDFSGEARLDASLSQAVGGFKSIFLKPFNPLFRKHGAGTVVPISISGTFAEPKFEMHVRDVFRKK